MAKQDYYDILGVGKNASDAEIKKAYRRAALKFHPDRNPGDTAAATRFRDAAEAYETLSDPEERKQYDLYGDDADRRRRTSEHAPPPPPHQEPSDIMEELYIELGWMLVNEHGRYIPSDIFEMTFYEELQDGIKLPFMYERTQHPATHEPAVWMKKIKKSTLSTKRKARKEASHVDFLKESLSEVGLSMEDLSFSELFKFTKDIGVSIGVKVLKTLVGRR